MPSSLPFPPVSPERLKRLQRIASALGPGSELVLVGGAVRDLLLGREGGDWDLASALLPEDVMDQARRAHLRAVPTGLQHGTVSLVLEGESFELTTFRGDGDYLDGRRPESVRMGVSLREDLARRDFTVNALALPVDWVGREGWADHVIDPFMGRADLEQGLLRAVGDPLLRFREDGLRPLRACRFASQLGFEVEGATRAAMGACLEISAKVAAERVQVELTKLLCGKAPEEGLRLLECTGLLDLWVPELRALVGCEQSTLHAFDVWDHTLQVVRFARPDPAHRWAALLHDVGKPAARGRDGRGRTHFKGHERHSQAQAEAILRRLRASRALTAQVLALIRHHNTLPTVSWSDAACRRFLGDLIRDGLDREAWGAFGYADLLAKGVDVTERLERHAQALRRLEALAGTNPPLTVKELALDGAALMALASQKGGPWLGELQRHLLESVLENPTLNESRALEDLARTWLEQKG